MDPLQLTAYFGFFLKLTLATLTFSMYVLLRKNESRISQIPLLLGISSSLFVLADIPVIFMPHFELVTPLLIAHSLLLIVTSYLRYMASFRFPKSAALAITGNVPHSLWYWERIGGIFMLIFAFCVVILNTVHGVITPEHAESVLRWIDLITSGTASVLFTSSFILSLPLIITNKLVRVMFIGFLILNLVLYLFFLCAFFIQPSWLTFEVGWITSNVCNLVSFFILMIYLSAVQAKSGIDSVEQNAGNETLGSVRKVQMTVDRGGISIKVWCTNAHGELVCVQMEKEKWMKPMIYWLAFVMAHQKKIELSHSDMSVIKFRMLDFLNKNASSSLRMQELFSGGRSLYTLKIEESELNILDENKFWESDHMLSTLMEFRMNWMKSVEFGDLEINLPRQKWTEKNWKGFFSNISNI